MCILCAMCITVSMLHVCMFIIYAWCVKMCGSSSVESVASMRRFLVPSVKCVYLKTCCSISLSRFEMLITSRIVAKNSGVGTWSRRYEATSMSRSCSSFARMPSHCLVFRSCSRCSTPVVRRSGA